jgi:hypothetical protein
MKTFVKLISSVLLMNQTVFTMQAQYTFFSPRDNFAIEVSLPNSDLKRLPAYRNSISSLICIDDQIVAGTSANEGLTPFIIVASLKRRQVEEIHDIEKTIPGQRAIASGFCRGKENSLFAGTMANIKKDGSRGTGHLIRCDIGQDGHIQITDLGLIESGEGIFSITLDADKEHIYGILFPSGYFFKYSILTKEIKTYSYTAPTPQQIGLLKEYDLSPQSYLCKSLIESRGFIFGSSPVNKIFYFDPLDESFHIVKEIPEVWGRRTLGQVECWAASADGTIYGGNAGDGQLFEIEPVAMHVKNLGKPIGMSRLRGLSFGRDGKLYGIAGGYPGYSHLFLYDEHEGFVDFGNPEFTMTAPGIEQGILWRGFQLGTITSSEDGNYIIMGEDESLSQLLVFSIQDEYAKRIGE